MQLDKENMKNPMAHRIRNSLIPGCPEPAHSHQHCQSSAWLSFRSSLALESLLSSIFQ